MSKYAIVTPTYSGHFGYIKEYLKSFERYLLDKDFPIYFIVDKSEKKSLEKITTVYKRKLNIRICTTEDVFSLFGITESSQEILKIIL